MLHERYRLNEPDVVSEEFDGETVILDLVSGVYCSFRGSGDHVWRLLVEGASPAEVLGALEAAKSPFRDEVETFITGLITGGLLCRADDPPTPAGTPDASGIGEAPVLERFEDLAELIMSDPIHDSDAERGWPLQRADPTPSG